MSTYVCGSFFSQSILKLGFVWQISFHETLIYNTLKFLLWSSSSANFCGFSVNIAVRCDQNVICDEKQTLVLPNSWAPLAVFGNIKNSNVPEKMQRKTYVFWHCNLNEWFYCPALWILVSANLTCWKFFSKDLKRESRHGQSAFHGWEQSGDEFGGRVFLGNTISFNKETYRLEKMQLKNSVLCFHKKNVRIYLLQNFRWCLWFGGKGFRVKLSFKMFYLDQLN